MPTNVSKPDGEYPVSEMGGFKRGPEEIGQH
jgi:hypothetical protein